MTPLEELATLSFLSRMLGTQADPHDLVRPLWHRVVELSREPSHYARCGVADNVDGRFDMIVHLLSLAMLRMETSSEIGHLAARVTELFVEDMDGQLRETGVGDSVGKHMGRLMSALGGRLGALRKVMADTDFDTGDAALAAVLIRNVHWVPSGGDPAALAASFRALSADFAARSDADMLAGKFG